MGAVSSACRKHVFHCCRFEKREDQLQRKRVLIAERQHEPVIGGRGLQLEIECAAKALPQGQSPGARDARTEGRVQDNCMPPA